MTKNDRIADLETDRDTAFLRIESAEKYAADLAKRLNSAEKNLVDHEHAIGGNSGKISLAESLDIVYGHLRSNDSAHEAMNRQLAGFEVRLGKYEESVGSWRRATEAVGGRLTGHDAALNEIRTDFSDRLHRVATQVYESQERLESVEKWLAALDGKFERHKARSVKLANGPKSYDTRIAALERKIDILKPTFPPTAEAYGERLGALEEAVVNLITERNDDPLRHVHWSAVPYSGTGDDATDDDAPDDLASRDIDSLVDQTAIAVRDFLAAQYQSLIEAGVAPYEARNRVALHRQEIVGRFVVIASEKY